MSGREATPAGTFNVTWTVVLLEHILPHKVHFVNEVFFSVDFGKTVVS